MDQILQTVVIVFMAFLCALCLFAVVVIVRDIISENATTRRSRERNRILEEAIFKSTYAVDKPEDKPAEPVVEKEVVVPTVVEPVAPATEEVVATDDDIVEEPATEEVDENEVTFSKHSLTMDEKYGMLSSEFKMYYDQITKHVLAKEGIKELKHDNSIDYKIGSYKVVRVSIKRGEIVCEFFFIDREFSNYATTSNVKMKRSATTVRVSEASAVGVVKDGIDLVCTQIAEDKEYKKNLAKEKRREKRRLAKEDTNKTTNA